MVTASDDVELAKSLLKRGAFDYVRKRFEWDLLHRCVAAALRPLRYPKHRPVDREVEESIPGRDGFIIRHCLRSPGRSVEVPGDA
jgi:DNA-binding NtrC family response regulator